MRGARELALLPPLSSDQLCHGYVASRLQHCGRPVDGLEALNGPAADPGESR
jgi:hypothetical protein